MAKQEQDNKEALLTGGLLLGQDPVRHFISVECPCCGGEGTIWLCEPEPYRRPDPRIQCDECWGYGYTWEERK